MVNYMHSVHGDALARRATSGRAAATRDPQKNAYTEALNAPAHLRPVKQQSQQLRHAKLIKDDDRRAPPIGSGAIGTSISIGTGEIEAPLSGNMHPEDSNPPFVLLRNPARDKSEASLRATETRVCL